MKNREAFDVRLEEHGLALHPPAKAEFVPVQSGTQPVGGLTKRCFDVVFAGISLLVFAPLMLLLAVIIHMHDKGPVFFRQTRIGHGGRTFQCLKFRTMVQDADNALNSLLDRDPAARAEWTASQKLKDDPRCTKLGRLMRRTSLDELPQLINVLRGEMSLVGPRPIVQSETRFYGADFPLYLSARPGLTGLWQVSGRSDTTYDDRVRLDALYVTSWSLLADVKIAVKTVVVVFRSDGSY